jgi:hypothetical protein
MYGVKPVMPATTADPSTPLLRSSGRDDKGESVTHSKTAMGIGRFAPLAASKLKLLSPDLEWVTQVSL